MGRVPVSTRLVVLEKGNGYVRMCLFDSLENHVSMVAGIAMIRHKSFKWARTKRYKLLATHQEDLLPHNEWAGPLPGRRVCGQLRLELGEAQSHIHEAGASL
jgi:hypothetical protein